MVAPGGRFGVVFNGAIYNFHDLRRQLEGRGYNFRTETDTEVLLHGYDAWGLHDLVARLQGMFAFALWDEARHTLFLVRDRLGVKPLLYTVRDGGVAFASTAEALKCGGFAGPLDPQAIAEYLQFGFVTDARCVYNGVQKLPAAHIAEFRNGRINLQRYWQPPEPSRMKRTFEAAVEQSEALFLRAVEMRLAADVPVGALLSGGIDSGLLCWAVAKLGGDITTYTIGTPGDPWDETADARETARELGVRHRVLSADPNTIENIRDLSAAFGEPFACASALGMLALSKVIRTEATVVLTGDGGDDIFLGYPRHRNFHLAQRIGQAMPRATAPLWNVMRPIVPRHSVARRAAHLLDYAFGGLGAIVSAQDEFRTYARHQMLGEQFDGLRTPLNQPNWSAESGRNVLGDFLEYERETRFVGEYMTKVDGATMYHGLEARSPFLDQEIWNFAGALPYDVRLHRGELKAILREIARRNVGERLASGKKRGFGIPVQRWIAGKWRKHVEEAFEYSILDRDGWIRSEAVLRTLHTLREGETAPMQLWYLYALENWMKQHNGSTTTRRLRISA